MSTKKLSLKELYRIAKGKDAACCNQEERKKDCCGVELPKTTNSNSCCDNLMKKSE